MDTLLYTSDMDGIHNRIERVLCGGSIDKLAISGNDALDYSDFATNIGNSGYGYNNNKNTCIKEKIELDEDTEDRETEDREGENVFKKKYEKMSASEMRLCEMEMVKYKQMLVQHEYEKGYRKKASILEREMNSKTVVKECNSLAEFAKAIDVSHSKWMRCSKKTQEKYIKEFVYRKYGIPNVKKTRQGGGRKKSKKSTFNIASINLNNCESGAEPNICVSTPEEKVKKTKHKQDKTDNKKIKITDEISKELEKYLQNLINGMYDDPENITYDYKNKQIEKLFL